jgi:predicted peptidase
MSFPQCVSRAPEQTHPDAPVISLNGDRVVVLNTGDVYIDAGAAAMDDQDGDLSADISAQGLSALNTAVKGDYLIAYTVNDSDGHAALRVTRVVRVGNGSFVDYSLREYDTTSAHLGFLEHLPTFYGDDPSQTYPLIIVNHGWGHYAQQAPVEGVLSLLTGTNIYRVFDNDAWPDSRPFIVLSPQRCIDTGDYEWGMVDQFIEWAVDTYQVDRSRIYMTGLSAGGYFTWRFPVLFPERVAAIVPMSAGGPVLPAAAVPDFCNAMRELPIWAFHGDADAVVDVIESIYTVETVLKLDCSSVPNPAPLLSIIDGAGHDVANFVWDDSLIGSGDPAYELFNQSIYDWFLLHSLP